MVLADIDGDAAKAAAEDVGGPGLACDVTSEEQVRAAVADTVAEFGRLDVFVNNAGVTREASLKKLDEVVRHISEGAGRNGASAFSQRGGNR